MATIRDVATRAGVAPSSVTRVLSGHPNVSEELRDRVLAAVQEVGYKPDLVAAGLRRGYTQTVGIVVNDVLNPVVAQMIDVVESDMVFTAVGGGAPAPWAGVLFPQAAATSVAAIIAHSASGDATAERSRRRGHECWDAMGITLRRGARGERPAE